MQWARQILSAQAGMSPLSAYAEDHGLWPWMNAKRITLRSLVRRRVCFGGFRRRTWRYHGLCPWGSINPVIAEIALDCDLSILVKANGVVRAFVDAKLTPRAFLVIKDDNPVFPFRYGLHYCFLSPGGVTPSFPLPI